MNIRANRANSYWIIRNKLMTAVMNAPCGITWGQIASRFSANGEYEYQVIEIFDDLVKENIVYEQNGYWFI